MLLDKSSATETSKFYTWIDDNGVAKTVVKKMAEIDLEDAIENSIVVNALAKDKKYPLIVDLRELKTMSKDARKHFAIKDRETNVVAIALLVESSLSKMFANFYLGINRPKVPVKLFNSSYKAEQWCTTFTQNSDERKGQ